MTDSDAGSTVPALSHEQDSAPLEQQEPKKQSSSGISLSIWPPSQRTRDAVITRLIETLSSESVLSKRYGTISRHEAEAAARQIEDEVFDVASRASTAEDDGLEILHLYSKEISKRMLDTVKARPKPDSAVNNGESGTPRPKPDSAVNNGESGTPRPKPDSAVNSGESGTPRPKPDSAVNNGESGTPNPEEPSIETSGEAISTSVESEA